MEETGERISFTTDAGTVMFRVYADDRLIFEKATAEYRLDHPEHSLMLYGARKSRPIKCRGIDGYQAEMAYFVQCIRTATPPTVVTAEDAAAAIRLVEAEVKSVPTGRPVRV